jgi:hypothetical protein
MAVGTLPLPLNLPQFCGVIWGGTIKIKRKRKRKRMS